MYQFCSSSEHNLLAPHCLTVLVPIIQFRHTRWFASRSTRLQLQTLTLILTRYLMSNIPSQKRGYIKFQTFGWLRLLEWVCTRLTCLTLYERLWHCYRRSSVTVSFANWSPAMSTMHLKWGDLPNDTSWQPPSIHEMWQVMTVLCTPIQVKCCQHLHVRTTLAAFSVSVRGAKIWNGLNEHLKHCTSASQLKKHYKL